VIIRVGGDDEKNAVERAWEKIGIPSVLAQVNWEGRKRKDREQKTGVARTKFLEVLLGNIYILPCLVILILFYFYPRFVTTNSSLPYADR